MHKLKTKEFQLKMKLWFNKQDITHTIFPCLTNALVSIYMTCLSNAYMDTKNRFSQLSESSIRIRLQDIIIDNTNTLFTQSGIPANISDILVQVSVICIFARLFTLKRRFCLVLRRILFTISLMYLLRSIIIVVTVLPPSLLSCYSPNKSRDLIWDSIILFLQLRTSCGDVFFSGHAIWFSVKFLLFLKYKPDFITDNIIRTIIYKIVISICLILELLSLVISAYHYTIDVLVSFFLCFIIFYFYHFLILSNYCDNTWYSKLVNWFDGKYFLTDYLDSCSFDTPVNSDVFGSPSQYEFKPLGQVVFH